MEPVLLTFAVIMACIAAVVAIACVVREADEASHISHEGWARGHRTHH